MIEEQLANTDISEHLPTLRLLSALCDSVVEFGVRSGVSTKAIISSGTPSVHVDIAPEPYPLKHPHAFVQMNTLNIEIPEVDMLFIDSDHTYDQLSKELALHGNKARKFLVFHDTSTYAGALIPAIKEFMEANPEWYVLAQYLNNNGLTVLTRIKTRATKLPLLMKNE